MDKQITRIKITSLEEEFECPKDSFDTPSNEKFFTKTNLNNNQNSTLKLKAIEPPIEATNLASLTPPPSSTLLNSSVPITRAASIMVTNAAKNIKRAFTVSHQTTNSYNTNNNNNSNNNRRSNKLQRMEDVGLDAGDNDVDMEQKTISVLAAQSQSKTAPQSELKSQSGQRKSGTIVQLIGKSTKLTACVNGDRKRSDSIDSIIIPDNYTKNIDSSASLSYKQNKKKIQIVSNTNCNQLSDNDRRSEQNYYSTNNCSMKEKMDNNIDKDLSIEPNQQKTTTRTTSSNSLSDTWSNENRFLRRSSIRKFLNHLAQHLAFSYKKVNSQKNGGKSILKTSTGLDIMTKNKNKLANNWPKDYIPGVMGLKNHGNTCFMNAVLQCLSHTDILAEYFVMDQYKVDLKRRNKSNSRKFGTKGELTEELANVLKALWTCQNGTDSSINFKSVVERYGSQFRSPTQHDAQEFLLWLLDKVHEDLNTATKRRYKKIKSNYGRSDEILAAETLANHIRCNNSFVQAVFQAQFRSSLTCPRCHKQSNTFDPFHCISVQLPQLSQQMVYVTIVYLDEKSRTCQKRIGLKIMSDASIRVLKDHLSRETGIRVDCMVLVDLQKTGFTRVFYDTQPIRSTLDGSEIIYCIEVPGNQVAKTEKSNTLPSQPKIFNSKPINSTTTPSSDLLLLVANVKNLNSSINNNNRGRNSLNNNNLERFGGPLAIQVPRDCSYIELQKKLLREMATLLRPEIFSYYKPLHEMFRIRLQDPSADPDTYIEDVDHPLLTEMIDLALSILSEEAGPTHIKVLLEWNNPELFFYDMSDNILEHENISHLMDTQKDEEASNDDLSSNDGILTLEQCLEHYTKAETLSAEDAWHCPHCQQYLPVVKTLGLWSLPDILVVHFKRFRQEQQKGANAAKLTTMVQFPLHSFDMSPHLAKGLREEDYNNQNTNINNNDNNTIISNDSAILTENNLNQHHRTTTTMTSSSSPWRKNRRSTNDSRSSTLSSKDNKETCYDLYAVCYHQGDTLETGHYTAACKNPYDHHWYKFDDQRVTRVNDENLPDEIVNNEAYMLFYQRKTSENAECSGSSSNSSDHWLSRIAPPPITTNIRQTEQEQIHASIKESDLTKPKIMNIEEYDLDINNADNLQEDVKRNDCQLAEIKIVSPEIETKAATISTTDENVVKIQINHSTLDEVDLMNHSKTNQLEQLKERRETLNEWEYVKDNTPQTIIDSTIKKTLNNTKIVIKTNEMEENKYQQPIKPISINLIQNNDNIQNDLINPRTTRLSVKCCDGNQSERMSVSSDKNDAMPKHHNNIISSTHPSLHIRHSFSTASNFRLPNYNESYMMTSFLESSANILFIEHQQQQHHQNHHHRHHHELLANDVDSANDDMEIINNSRSLWMSPITPHKQLITILPKN